MTPWFLVSVKVIKMACEMLRIVCVILMSFLTGFSHKVNGAMKTCCERALWTLLLYYTTLPCWSWCRWRMCTHYHVRMRSRSGVHQWWHNGWSSRVWMLVIAALADFKLRGYSTTAINLCLKAFLFLTWVFFSFLHLIYPSF